MSLEPKEQEWLEGLFDTYYDRVYAFLYTRTGNYALSEDLASQTFVKIAENFRSYRKDKGALSTWIFTIALNEMRSYYRRQKGKESITLDDISELSASDDTEMELVHKETKNELRTWLSHLDERSRLTVTLKYYGDLSNREIANILEISESNVGTILNRAIKKIKKSLEMCDEIDKSAYKSQEGKK